MESWLRELIEQGGYLGIAFLMFLETVFPPVPSEVIMSLAGFQAARGALTLPGVIAAGVTGAMFGNVFWYLLARAYGFDRFRAFTERHGRLLTIHPEELDRAQSWFRRYGGIAVGVGRVLPTARSLISVPAGILKMRLLRFFVYSLIGTTVWTSLLALAGYGLAFAFKDAEKLLDPISLGIIALLVAVYVYRYATYHQRAA